MSRYLMTQPETRDFVISLIHQGENTKTITDAFNAKFGCSVPSDRIRRFRLRHFGPVNPKQHVVSKRLRRSVAEVAPAPKPRRSAIRIGEYLIHIRTGLGGVSVAAGMVPA